MPILSQTEPTTSISVEVVVITPDLAQRWLGLNTSNRKLKPAVITALTRDIVEGRWVMDGNAIRFSGPSYKPEKLLDGQNRLHAILKAGTPVASVVIFGLPVEAQKSMDSGTKRTVADNLTIEGVKNAAVVAAAAALAIRAEEGKLDSSISISTARAMEWVEDHPRLITSAEVASRYSFKSDVAKSLIAYSHFRFSEIDLGEATAFWRDAAEKVGLEAGDPVLAMSNRFASARRDKERVPNTVALSAIFRTWNARRLGQKVRTVAFTVNSEGLPRLR